MEKAKNIWTTETNGLKTTQVEHFPLICFVRFSTIASLTALPIPLKETMYIPIEFDERQVFPPCGMAEVTDHLCIETRNTHRCLLQLERARSLLARRLEIVEKAATDCSQAHQLSPNNWQHLYMFTKLCEKRIFLRVYQHSLCVANSEQESALYFPLADVVHKMATIAASFQQCLTQ